MTIVEKEIYKCQEEIDRELELRRRRQENIRFASSLLKPKDAVESREELARYQKRKEANEKRLK